MISQAAIELRIKEWKTVGRELGIEVIAPYVLSVDGREYQCLALVPNFSGRGQLVAIRESFDSNELFQQFLRDAHQVGYTYAGWRADETLSIDKYKEILDEWGYYGPPDECPPWCVEGNYSRVWVSKEK